jgi:hypothetical protein
MSTHLVETLLTLANTLVNKNNKKTTLSNRSRDNSVV